MGKIGIEIKWGIYFIIMALFWMFLERLVGLHSTHIDKHPIYTNLFAIPAIAIYVYALLDKKKNDYNGTMSYKQAFVSGLIITLVFTIFSPLSQYLIATVISPEYFPNAIAYAVETDYMTQEEAESYFSISNYMLQGLIGAPIMGIITTAIVSIFVKSKKS